MFFSIPTGAVAGGDVPPPLPARKPKLFSITKAAPPLPPPPRDYPGSTENLLDKNGNGVATLPTGHNTHPYNTGPNTYNTIHSSFQTFSPGYASEGQSNSTSTFNSSMATPHTNTFSPSHSNSFSTFNPRPTGHSVSQTNLQSHPNSAMSQSTSDMLPQSASFAEKMSIFQSGRSPYRDHMAQSRSFSETLPHNMALMSMNGAVPGMESTDTLDLIETTDTLESGPTLTMNMDKADAKDGKCLPTYGS